MGKRACFVHALFECALVDLELAFLAEQLGEIDWEAKCVVELEGEVAREHSRFSSVSLPRAGIDFLRAEEYGATVLLGQDVACAFRAFSTFSFFKLLTDAVEGVLNG